MTKNIIYEIGEYSMTMRKLINFGEAVEGTVLKFGA
jgi:hypothetical protein